YRALRPATAGPRDRRTTRGPHRSASSSPDRRGRKPCRSSETSKVRPAFLNSLAIGSANVSSAKESAMIQIDALPAFSDNYLWLLQDHDSRRCAVVDPGDAAPVLDWLAEHDDWRLT